MIRSAHRPEVPLDTLGQLADRRHRLFGWCLRCSATYRPALGPADRPAAFDIDLDALIAERGRGIVGLAAVTCPRCGSGRTEMRLLPPWLATTGVIGRSSNYGRPGA